MFLKKGDPGRGLRITIIVLVVILVLVVGASAGYFIYNLSNQQANINANQNIATNNDFSNVNIDTASTTPIDQSDDLTQDRPTEETTVGDIQWIFPKQLGNFGIIKADNQDFYYPGTKYYKIGNFVSGKYKGGILVLMDASPQGPSFYSSFYRFAKVGDKIYFLKNASDSIDDNNYFAPAGVKLDQNLIIKELQFPKSFIGPHGIKFERDEYARGFFDLSNQKKIFNQPGLGDVYTTDSSPTNTRTALLMDKNGFYIRAADGTVMVYKYKPKFFNDKNVPQIIWNNGQKNNEEYDYTSIGGCGSENYMNIVNSDTSSYVKDRLVSAGKTNNGDLIYEFKDKEDSELKNRYENEYFPVGEKISFEEYVKNRPSIFWIDPFGRLVELQNKKFLQGVECGKPVIYLYPQQKEIVSVKLAPQGGFTYTEPDYGSGWIVEADINSNLREIKLNKIYPYLFWEGRGGIYNSPDKGFVVAQNGVHQFLLDKLAQLGLNKKETADFMEFWEPRMTGSPYYFVSFMGNQVMNQLAPLTINPKPDTIIRILMDFRPLDKPIIVQGYNIKTPERKGFTVVEWGGVLK